MSVSGITSTSFFQNPGTSSTQSKFQQFRQEFQQLGKDLQSGNLTQAQSDFATLQQNATGTATPTNNSTVNSTNSPIAQAFNQLAQDLQSGNLTGAQSDFATLQQDLQQSGGTQGHPHHPHHRASSARSSQSDNSATSINQSFAALGQSLRAGNLEAAQQSYSTLQQELDQYSGLPALPATTASTPSATGTNALSVTA